MSLPMTERKRLVLDYVRKRSNCTLQDVIRDLHIPRESARDTLDALYVMGLVGRQLSLLNGGATTWSAGQPLEEALL